MYAEGGGVEHRSGTKQTYDLIANYPADTLLDSRPLKMGPIGCPEMSVRNYHYSLRNNSEECSSQIHKLSI